MCYFQLNRRYSRGYKGSRIQGFEWHKVKRQRSMLKNYKDLKLWQKSYELCLEIYRITAKKDIAEIERMLKALIKSLENKPLNPWPLESLDPLLQLKWRRTKFQWLLAVISRFGPVSSIYTQRSVFWPYLVALKSTIQRANTQLIATLCIIINI